MAQIYVAIPTNIGITKIQQAMWAGIKLKITHLVYGDGGGEYYYPTPDMTSLVNEVGMTTTQSMIIDTEINTTWVSAIIGSNLPECTIREIGLVDEAGDLCFIANTPEIDKVNLADGTLVDIPLELGIKNTYTDQIEIPIQPSADYATKEWVLNAISAGGFATVSLDNINDAGKKVIEEYGKGPIFYEVYEYNAEFELPEDYDPENPPVDPDAPVDPDDPTEDEEIIDQAEWVDIGEQEADTEDTEDTTTE